MTNNNPGREKKTVCLIVEGSYPYITGGVSSWIQDIITGLFDFNFIIYALSADEENELKYKIPENVTSIENRILTAPSGDKHKKIDKNFFSNIIKSHEKFIRNREFSDLGSIVKIMKEKKYTKQFLVSHKESWDIVSGYGDRHNPLYPFSEYYWAWLASHEYLIKILTWDIPEADLYHPISTGYAGLTAAVAKITYNKPVILTEHGLYNKEREIDIKRAQWVKGYQRDMWINIFNDLSKITYDYSDLVISLFEHNRNIQISQGAGREKTLVIPNGIDVDRFLDLKKESRSEFSIGFVGRVVPIKDVKTFIIASKIIAEKIQNFKIYIIGPQDEDKPYMEECLQLVDNFKLGEHVIFTGKADVREYYKFIDIMVLSSIREAQPLVILEAYCAGIPVVSTRVGNVPEMLDYDENLLSDPKDSQKLASNIIFLMENQSYRDTLIKKNRDKVLNFYSKKDLIDKYRAIYNGYISGDMEGVTFK